MPDGGLRQISAAEREVAAGLPAALAAVLEQGEPLDVEPRGEAGQVLEHLVEGLRRHVLGDRDVRVVREARASRRSRGAALIAAASSSHSLMPAATATNTTWVTGRNVPVPRRCR